MYELRDTNIRRMHESVELRDRPTGISSTAKSIAIYSEKRLDGRGLGCIKGVGIGIS